MMEMKKYVIDVNFSDYISIALVLRSDLGITLNTSVVWEDSFQF